MTGYTGNAGTHFPSSSVAPRNPTVAYPLLHHHQLHQTLMIPIQPPPSLPPCGGAEDDELRRRDGRFPQWSNRETRELIEIRAQLEWAFKADDRNINLWELVAERIREKGYGRSADQCKCKWENLVNGYEGQESSDVDRARPFFNELHGVFSARATGMQQSQVEAETGAVRGGKRLNDALEDQSCEDFIEEQEDEEEIEVGHRAGKGRVAPERKAGRDKRQKMKANENKNGSNLNSLQEIMRKFNQQQQMIDMEWRAAMERHAEERERFEQEWRQRMENLEREALMMEQAWREKEEERKVREERRAEQRDALVTALLNQLVHEESP